MRAVRRASAASRHIGAPAAPGRLGPVRTRFQTVTAAWLATPPASAHTADRTRRGTRFAAPVAMLTDKLIEMAREYHQLQGVRHVRGAEAEGNAAHRKMGQKMADIAARFERLIEHWLAGDPRAEAWRRHLYDGAPLPDGPDLAEP